MFSGLTRGEVITSAMRLIFFLKMLKTLYRFQKANKICRKFFLVFQTSAFELVAGNSPYYNDNTSHR